MADDASVQDQIGDGTNPVRLVIIGVIAAIAVIFVLSNLESTSVSFLGWDFEMPLVIVLVGAVLVGAVLGQALMWFLRRRGSDDS